MEIKLRNMAAIYLCSENKILLLYRMGSRIVSNSYIGSAGGHFEKEELNDAKACVLRELNEEMGLSENDIDNLALRYVTLRLKDGEVRQNYYYFANLKDASVELTSNEGKVEWFDLEKIADLEMPFTAKYVIEHYIKEGRNTDILYGGIGTEIGIEFKEMRDF